MSVNTDRHHVMGPRLLLPAAALCSLLALAGCAERAAEASADGTAAAPAGTAPATAAEAGLPAIEDADAPPVPLAEPVQGDFEEAILLTGELKAVRATSI